MNVKFFLIGLIPLVSFAAFAVNNSLNVTVVNGRIQAAPSEKIILADNFSNNRSPMWNPIRNYKDRLDIRSQSFFGKTALLITKKEKSEKDTAFELFTDQ